MTEHVNERKSISEDLEAGAANLVFGCAEITPDQRVLVVTEHPSLGWFDRNAAGAVADVARRAGADVSTLTVGDPAERPSENLRRSLLQADVAIFFARIGDQERFVNHGDDPLRIVSYARTDKALASSFGTTDHGEMCALKSAVDRALMDAARIEISCPQGTRLTGPGPAKTAEAPDVTVRRFPMCVPAPVSAKGFSGEVVLEGYLTPTGSQVYEPASLLLPEPVIAEVERGRIVRFRGAAAIVSRIEAHYKAVADRFGIEADIVHSWHAGIHPGCTFEGDIDADPDLWSNTAFGSPDYLHFHTCGDYPPGEICWMVASPTISADGQAIWSRGALDRSALARSG